MGLLVLVSFYAILGFILAFVANIVMQQDVMEVKTGIIITVVSGLVARLLAFALSDMDPLIALAILLGVYYAVLTTMICVFGRLPLARSALISIAFAIIYILSEYAYYSIFSA
ncbi:MAG: hypothetical protein VX528_06205 [Candidatus Latescibacterota bacterium]|nr:hypothetical protein [Candidatus Latescibacterota bacterium]